MSRIETGAGPSKRTFNPISSGIFVVSKCFECLRLQVIVYTASKNVNCTHATQPKHCSRFLSIHGRRPASRGLLMAEKKPLQEAIHSVSFKIPAPCSWTSCSALKPCLRISGSWNRCSGKLPSSPWVGGYIEVLDASESQYDATSSHSSGTLCVTVTASEPSTSSSIDNPWRLANNVACWFVFAASFEKAVHKRNYIPWPNVVDLRYLSHVFPKSISFILF